MRKIIIAFIVIIVQISCSPSSQKEFNFPKNYDDLSSYLNWKDQENMEMVFLRPFEYRKNTFLIIIPQENIVLFERKSDSNLEKSVFDVYDMQLPSNQEDNVKLAFRQGRYSNSDQFNYLMNCFSNVLIFRETIEIRENNFDILENIIHGLCVEDLNIIDDWTKIHIVKKLRSISINVQGAITIQTTTFHYEYIDNKTPAKKIDESYYFRLN